ncbi:hypothetical protein BGZ73_000075 [Actinomortierella ambigua]|nr:hypothetical protein BGZ73_000075 [Actinomortierella ambigua]
MLSARTGSQQQRAAKAQSLYVTTPSMLDMQQQSLHANSSIPLHSSLQHQYQQQLQHPSSPTSPRKARPFSMFVQPQDTALHHHYQQASPFDSQGHPDQDDGSGGDTQSLSSTMLDFEHQDLKDADSDTRTLIHQLADLDDLASFLKKRSVMEAEYGTNIVKGASALREAHRLSQEGKQGSYGECWNKILEMHERMGSNHLELSRDLQILSEELSIIYKETEKSRKQFKEAGAKQERILQEHDHDLEKAKVKYDTSTEEWERAILQKANDPSAPKRTLTKTMTMNIFRQPKSPGSLHKQEEEARLKAATAHEQYKKQLAKVNDVRQYYFSTTLPSILKNVKDTIDEFDMALQYHLVRYGYMSEDYMMKDAMVLNPIEGPELGLRDLVMSVSKDADLRAYVNTFTSTMTPCARTSAPYQEYTMSAQAQSIINTRPVFGVDLAEQLIRDETDLPEIVVKCTQAIEQFGMDTMGIYRVSGIHSATNRLRAMFDRDCSAVDLTNTDEYMDINSVASVLKSWFRELPDPLLTRELYPRFIEAATIEDPGLRLMNIHEVTNQLPDPNYATLKFLMAHLNKVQANREVTKMGASNLGLIFGPTLMCSSNPGAAGANGSSAGAGSGGGDAVENLADMSLQCRVIETILDNYVAIFEMDEEEEEGHQEEEHDADGSDDPSQYVPDQGEADSYAGGPEDHVLDYVPPPPSDGLVPGGGAGGGMMATSHHHRHSVYVHDNYSHPTVPEEEEEEEENEEEEVDRPEESGQYDSGQRDVQGQVPSIAPALAEPFMNRSREFDPDLYDRRHYELDPRYLPIGQQQQ